MMKNNGKVDEGVLPIGELFYLPGYVDEGDNIKTYCAEEPFKSFQEAEKGIPDMLKHFDIGLDSTVIISFKRINDEQAVLSEIYEFNKLSIN